MKDSELLFEAHGVSKSFPEGDGGSLSVLSDVDLVIHRGESVAIVGNSGCGKSTFLEVCASLLRPDAGTIRFDGNDLGTMDDAALSALRNQRMGFVFQNSLLLGDFTALENVMIPCMIGGIDGKDARKKAEELLRQVGLSDRFHHRNDTLSGGERQRVAVARALAQDPMMVFADEPTGSLDETNARMVEDLLLSLVKEHGASLVLATHNLGFAKRCNRVLHLHDRKLYDA